MSQESIRLERRGALAWLVMDRPGRRNALDSAALRRLRERAEEAAGDPAVRVLAVRGAGGHFSAGADIDELALLTSPAAARAHARMGQAACNALEHAPMPVIAAIRGSCVGGGLELAMACDLRIASPDARIGQVELGIGSIAAWGGLRRLPRLVGVAAAKDLVYSGRHLDAAEAQSIGLVGEVVDAETIEERVAELAEGLSLAPQRAIAASKRALDQWLDVPLQAGLEQDRETFGLLSGEGELREGVQRFLARSGRSGRSADAASGSPGP